MPYSKMQITKAKSYKDIEDFMQTTSSKYCIKKVLLGHKENLIEDMKRKIEPRLKIRGQVYAALFTIKVQPMGSYFKDKEMILNWADKHLLFFNDYFGSNTMYMDVKFNPKEDNAMLHIVMIPICANNKLSFGGMLNGVGMKEFKDAYNKVMVDEFNFEIVEELGKNALKKQIEELKKEKEILKTAIALFIEDNNKVSLQDADELFKNYEHRARYLAN